MISAVLHVCVALMQCC